MGLLALAAVGWDSGKMLLGWRGEQLKSCDLQALQLRVVAACWELRRRCLLTVGGCWCRY